MLIKAHRNFSKNPVCSHFYFAEQDEDEQKEVAKLLNEISGENRKKEGRKDTSLEAASVKELNIQPQEGKVD